MKSNTAWLPAVARRKQERRRPIVSGSAEMSGTKAARKPAKAACVARTRAATLFTWSPGESPVSAPARRPSIVTNRKPATRPRGVNDGRVPSVRVKVSGARRLLPTAASLPWPPPSAPRGLDHEEVIAAEFERCFGGQRAPTSVPHEEVLPRATVVPALETLRPKDSAFREDRRGPLAGQESDGAANPVSSRVAAAASGSGDQSVFLDSERVRELEGFDGRVAGVRHVRVDA